MKHSDGKEKGLALDKLSFAYPVLNGFGLSVFENVDLRLAPGHFYVLHGSNGSGKTTFFRILAGFLKKGVSGSIYLDGIRLNNKPPHEISRHLSYVSQNTIDSISPSLTVASNIMVSLKRPASCFKGNEVKSAYEKVLKGYAKLENRELSAAGTLSGGERQRLAMALSIAGGKRLWLLDEPTANLDEESRIGCINLMSEVSLDQPELICLLISHDPSLFSSADIKRPVTHLELINKTIQFKERGIEYNPVAKEMTNGEL